MNGPGTRGRIVSNGFLSASPDTQQLSSSHRRSTSSTPSFRSDRSSITVVEESSEYLDIPEAIKRQKTRVTQVKFSRLDCLKALFFGLRKFQHKVAASTIITTAEADDSDIGMFDHKSCPFNVTVSVWPRNNPVIREHHHKAKCTFDTGCLQGNIVSLDFAHSLGYTEFKSLHPREQNGGTSVTGHMVKVEGAIHLTWHHSTSPRIYRNMRFLVSANAPCELLIGAHSLVRHDLISPPNLLNSDKKIHNFKSSSDIEGEDLAGEAADLKTEIEDLKRKLGKQEGEEHKKLEKRIKKKEKKLEILTLKLDKHKANELMKGRPDKEREALLSDYQKQIDELEAEGGKTKKKAEKVKTEKEKASRAPQATPDIKVVEEGGKSRTPTGFSSLRLRNKK